jgi:tRNA threonylcarbamoyladenosine biosynthesis protein TsaB
VAPRQHNQLLLPMIDALFTQAALKPSQLDAVAFGCGPGSFTGVRIAASVAQGIALGRGIVTLPISTLRVLAQTAMATYPDASTLLATIRSRPGEIYVGRYHSVDGICHQQGDEVVMRTVALELPDDCAADWCVVGDAADQLAGALGPRNLHCSVDAAVLPRASALLALAQHEFEQGAGVTAAFALPVYLEGTAPWRKLTD